MSAVARRRQESDVGKVLVVFLICAATAVSIYDLLLLALAA